MKTNADFSIAKNSKSIRFAILVILVCLSTNYISAQECSNKGKTAAKETIEEKLWSLSWNQDNQSIIKLLEANKQLVNIKLNNQETLLTVAAYQGNYELAKYLVENGGDIHCKNKWGSSPVFNATLQGKVDIIRLLVSKGALLNILDGENSTLLHVAVNHNHPEVVKYLIENGADVNAMNDVQQSPLIIASWYGNPIIIKALIDEGANINPVGGGAVMHNLARTGNVESLQILLDKGADVNTINDDGQLPVYVAVINGKYDALKLLLSKTKQINLAEKHLANTPLHIAAINGDLKSTKILIEAGADPKQLNKNQMAPADCAAKYGYTDVVEYYVSKGLASKKASEIAEKSRLAANEKPKSGETRLIYCGHSGWAIENGNNLIVFDYWGINKGANTRSLANGALTPEDMKDKNVYVFVSHSHRDHYDTTIFAWHNKAQKIKYIFGFKPEKSDIKAIAAGFNFIGDNQTQKIDQLSITTIKSNDSGQGFLVECNGITIFHPGDHAYFAPEDEVGFKKEIDFVASKYKNIDIAFLPVTGCPSRWKKENIVNGFFYTIEKLNPQKVFPMHAFQMEYNLKEFAELSASKKLKTKVLCAENCGDSFSYAKLAVAGK